MNPKYIAVFVVLFVLFGSFLMSSNYQFQVEKVNKGDSVPLGPVQFSSPASDTNQYIDATQSTVYGTIISGPPSGMGTDDASYTTLTEASYADTSYTLEQYAGFGSLPLGWTATYFTVSSGMATSDNTASTRYLQTTNYDMSSYDGAKITFKHRALDYVNYNYEGGDYKIYYESGTLELGSVYGSDHSGDWKTQSMEYDNPDITTNFRLQSVTADAEERIQTDDWYIYGRAEITCYRFEAVFRFDSVTTGLASYALYVDFYSALSDDDDLDFYIGTTTDPTTMIAADRQDDFNVVVTSYVTASTIYLKIADNYRSGDTVQTPAYIQRCYLFTPEAGWYNEQWTRRQSISLTGSSGAGTGYQVNFTVPYDSDMQSDFSDLIFTDNDGETPLPFWVQDYTTSTTADIWVKVADDLGSNTLIYMYYGNTGATSQSSIGATMIIGDDFSGATLNTTLWDTQGSVTLSDGWARFYGSGVCDYPEIKSKSSFNFNIRNTKTEMLLHITTVTPKQHGWSIKSTGSGYLMYSLIDDSAVSSGFMIDWNGGGYDDTYTGLTYSAGYDYYMSMSCDALSSPKQEWFTNLTTHTYSTNTMTSTNDYYLMYGNYNWGGSGDVSTWDEKMDYIFLRKFINSEPAFDSFGDEEIGDFAAPMIAATNYSPGVPTISTGMTLFAIVTDLVGVEDVWFKAIAYPEGFSDVNYHATEVGTNTWAYSFDGADLPVGVYCFVTYAADLFYQSMASATQYLTIQVSDTTIICYIRIFDSLGDYIPFETFEVYRDGARQYTSSFSSLESTSHDILVKDRWGETLNFTTFDAGTEELVVIVDVYSLKVQSWYSDYVYFNLTRSGLTFTQVIAPLEIVNFRLYENVYNWAIDYRNETGNIVTGSTNLTKSDCIVITGSTISDVAGLSQTLLELSTQINVTLTSTNNQVLTISLDLINTNTTINNQLVYLLLNVTNSNSTLYQQTVDLLAAVQNNASLIYNQIAEFIIGVYANQSLIYGQTVSLLSQLNLIGSNVTASYISLSASLSAIDSSLASNFTEVVADLTSIGSDVTTDYLSLAATLNALDSSLFANFTSVVSVLSLIGSNVTSNYLSLSAALINVNSTLFNQTVELMLSLENVNSTIYNQTVSLLLLIQNSNMTELYNQTITILSYIANNNVTMYNQVITILNTISNQGTHIDNQFITVLTKISQIPVTKGISPAEMAQLLGLSDDNGDGVPDTNLPEKIAAQQLPFQVVIIVILLLFIGVMIKVVRDIMPGVARLISNARSLNLKLGSEQ